jgi:hypothetical protein
LFLLISFCVDLNYDLIASFNTANPSPFKPVANTVLAGTRKNSSHKQNNGFLLTVLFPIVAILDEIVGQVSSLTVYRILEIFLQLDYHYRSIFEENSNDSLYQTIIPPILSLLRDNIQNYFQLDHETNEVEGSLAISLIALFLTPKYRDLSLTFQFKKINNVKVIQSLIMKSVFLFCKESFFTKNEAEGLKVDIEQYYSCDLRSTFGTYCDSASSSALAIWKDSMIQSKFPSLSRFAFIIGKIQVSLGTSLTLKEYVKKVSNSGFLDEMNTLKEIGETTSVQLENLLFIKMELDKESNQLQPVVASSFSNSSSSTSRLSTTFGDGLISDLDYQAIQKIVCSLSAGSSEIIPSVAFEQRDGMGCLFDVNKFASLMNDKKKGRLFSSVNHGTQNSNASLSADQIMKESIHNSWSLNDLMDGSDSD